MCMYMLEHVHVCVCVVHSVQEVEGSGGEDLWSL